MDFTFVTGKLRQGKTLASIDRIKKTLQKGNPVATNIDLNLKMMFGRNARNIYVVRIPDRPSHFDLEVIGRAYKGAYDESRNGLLVLDECGDWFNARNWSDKGRAEVNTWFRHAGKLGWSVDLIVQDIEIVDSQARKALAASIARCKRMDKVAIPFVTTFCKWVFGINVRPNKFHMARVEDSDGVFQDRWVYKGTHLYATYDTTQIFRDDYPHGSYCMLTPWHIYGRNSVPMNLRNIMRITKIYWKRFSSPLAFVVGSLLSAALTFGSIVGFESKPDIKPEPKPVISNLKDSIAGYFISGYSHYPGKVPVYRVLDSEGLLVDLDALKSQGFRFSPYGKCELRVNFGDMNETITCNSAI